MKPKNKRFRQLPMVTIPIGGAGFTRLTRNLSKQLKPAKPRCTLNSTQSREQIVKIKGRGKGEGGGKESEKSRLKECKSEEHSKALNLTQKSSENLKSIKSEIFVDVVTKGTDLNKTNTCQMSPLLFESDTDDEDLIERSLEIRTTVPASVANVANKKIDNEEIFQIFANLHDISNKMNNKEPTTQKSATKNRRFSEPLLSQPTTSCYVEKPATSDRTNKDVKPKVVVRKRNRKQSFNDPLDTDVDAPRTTRLSAIKSKILTRSSRGCTEEELNEKSLRKQSRKISKKTIEKRDSVRCDTNLQDNQVAQSISLLSNQNLRKNPLKIDEVDVWRTKYDFDLTIKVPKPRHRSLSSDVVMLSQRHPIISIADSSETITLNSLELLGPNAPSQETQMNDKKDVKTFLKDGQSSPDLFDNSETDSSTFSSTSHLPAAQPLATFLPKSGFFANLLKTSTPIEQNKSNSTTLTPSTPKKSTGRTLSQSSIRLFCKKLTNPTKQLDPWQRIAAATSAQKNNSDIFEITKNEQFSNKIRIKTNREMSPIEISDDDKEERFARHSMKLQEILRKYQPTVPAKPIEMSKITTTSKLIDQKYIINNSSEDLSILTIPSSQEAPLMTTPKRRTTELPPRQPATLSKRRNSPSKKQQSPKKSVTPKKDDKSNKTSPSMWRTKRQSSELSPLKTPNRQRRLDLWFKDTAYKSPCQSAISGPSNADIGSKKRDSFSLRMMSSSESSEED